MGFAIDFVVVEMDYAVVVVVVVVAVGFAVESCLAVEVADWWAEGDERVRLVDANVEDATAALEAEYALGVTVQRVTGALDDIVPVVDRVTAGLEAKHWEHS